MIGERERKREKLYKNKEKKTLKKVRREKKRANIGRKRHRMFAK